MLGRARRGPTSDPSEIYRHRAQLEEAKALLAERGIECETVLGQGDPGDVIVQIAEERGADLIVAGSRGHNPFEAAARLRALEGRDVHRAHCDVLVVRSA